MSKNKEVQIAKTEQKVKKKEKKMKKKRRQKKKTCWDKKAPVEILAVKEDAIFEFLNN